ncbi:MAG: AI-2E family transporter, partial [Pseudomonadota bacterium]
KMVGWFLLDHELTFSDLEEYLDVGLIVTSLASIFTGLAGKTLIVVIYTGFLLYEQKFFDHKIIHIIKDQKTEDHVRTILHQIDTRIQRYIGIKSLNSAIDSLLTFAILTAVGLDFAEFWGVLAFFLHFIPYAGSLIAITVPSLIAFIQFGDPTLFFVVGISIGLCHAFIGHFLEPYMMGRNLNLSPIFIISFLAMWGLIWGIPGMFLAVPILAILVISFSQFPRTRPLAVLMSKTGNLAD